MPKPILQTKHHLLNWLYENTKSSSVRRAMDDGTIRNLGWYKKVAGSRCPGWVIELYTRHAKIFYVAVVSDADKLENRTYELVSLAGCEYQGGESELYKGDL
jgi:hypothetical protein